MIWRKKQMINKSNYKIIKFYDRYYIADKSEKILDLAKNNLGFNDEKSAQNWFNDFSASFNKTYGDRMTLEAFCRKEHTTLY